VEGREAGDWRIKLDGMLTEDRLARKHFNASVLVWFSAIWMLASQRLEPDCQQRRVVRSMRARCRKVGMERVKTAQVQRADREGSTARPVYGVALRCVADWETRQVGRVRADSSAFGVGVDRIIGGMGRIIMGAGRGGRGGVGPPQVRPINSYRVRSTPY
jgi:hypothetical protein